MTAKRSRLRLHEVTAEEILATGETAVEGADTEVTETMGSEMIEGPEEISETEVTDLRDASTAERTDISQGNASNVSYMIISARKPREFNRDRNDRNEERGGYRKRSRSRSGDRHKKSRRRSPSSSSR